MELNNKFLSEAIKEANKSTYKFKVGAIIIDKNKIISRGHNFPCKSVKNLHPKFLQFTGSIHAEVDCIIRAKRNLKGMDMIVVRVNKKNQLRLAKPCQFCQKYLRHVGIKKIFFSTNDGIKLL